MSLRVIAFILLLVVGLIVLLWIRDVFDRNLDRAPTGMHTALLATLGGGCVLALLDVVTFNTVLGLVAGLAFVSAVWGWVRYRRSPPLRRWEATWERVHTHLKSGDEAAADRLMMAALREDDSELEQLRAAAPHDRRAALEFQRRTEAELRDWTRTAERSSTPVGSRILVPRKRKLEADLEWVRALLSSSSGAA